MVPMPCLQILPAAEHDVPLVLSFIGQLAEYEKLAHEVTATEDSVREALLGECHVAEAILAWLGGRPVGFAVFFHTFSTFVGRPGLYLEDLYVEPEYRKRGVGRAILAHLAKLARDRGCGRFEWAVLDWNEPAIRFYKKLGAAALDDWTVYRLAGGALERLAREA